MHHLALKDLRPYIPHNFERYLEVNVESANILRAFAPKKSILHFSSAEIFDIYSKVRNNLGLTRKYRENSNSYRHYIDHRL